MTYGNLENLTAALKEANERRHENVVKACELAGTPGEAHYMKHASREAALAARLEERIRQGAEAGAWATH